MGWHRSADLPFEEKMLWACVLRRAVFDYVLYKGVRSMSIEWKKAYQYVFSPGLEYENGLSFEEVCELFNWDPEYLRRLTLKLTREDVKKMETSQFRGDFTFDQVAAVVERTKRWESSGFAVPFCPMYELNKEYRDMYRPKVIHKERFLEVSVPMVRWMATVPAAI